MPKGVSRHQEGRCWRLYVVHEDGLVTGYVYDDPSPIDSLEKAYGLLIDALQGVTSRFDTDKRSRSPGVERDPLIDTGFTGVTVSRTSRADQKYVVVTAAQMVELPGGDVDVRSFYSGAIKESSLEEDPLGQEKTFQEMLKKAVAVRRYYNRMRSQGVYSDSAYKYDDVPDDIRRQPVELPDLDLHEIMDSFTVVPRHRAPRTTGGDPVALANSVQNADLTKPQKPFWLEDRCVKFYRREVEGLALYLPTSVYRARNEWRVRIVHRDGILTKSVPDADYDNSLLASLQEAWIYTVSLYCQYPAQKDRAKQIKHPLLDTGIPSVSMQPMCRVSAKTGQTQWAFSLKVRQQLSEGDVRTYSIEYWRMDVLDDASLSAALCQAAATIAYRDHQISQGASLDKAFVDKDDSIPDEFWPAEPVCMITEDDLRYYAERREKESAGPITPRLDKS